MHLRGGEARRLGRAPISLSRVARLEVASVRAGYRVTPVSFAAGATVRLIATRPQSSAPTPGPTVAVTLARHASAHATFAARLTPTSSQ